MSYGEVPKSRPHRDHKQAQWKDHIGGARQSGESEAVSSGESGSSATEKDVAEVGVDAQEGTGEGEAECTEPAESTTIKQSEEDESSKAGESIDRERGSGQEISATTEGESDVVKQLREELAASRRAHEEVCHGMR